jgi:hypothetical protein
VKISDNQRAFLISKMADESVASIWGKSVGWVRKARAFIAEEAEPAKIDEAVSAPALAGRIDHQEETPDALSPPNRTPVPACPERAQLAVAAVEPVAGDTADHGLQRDEAGPADLAQIDIEEAIAAAEPLGPYGSPAGLSPADLAGWMVDNTDLAFDKIADVAGVELAHVQAIADGEPWPPPPMPPPAEPPGARVFLQTPPAPTRVVREAPGPPARAVAEIPPRVIRWARWFVEAGWRVGEVARLFDCQPLDLKAALASA